MRLFWLSSFAALALTALSFAQEPPRDATAPTPGPPAPAQPAPRGLPSLPPDAPRMALVIGQSAYQAGPLATAVNDAGLVAEALRGAGFDVTAGADLDEGRLREMVRGFIDRVEQAPTDSAVFVFLAGRALQYEGENIFLPVGDRLEREGDALLHGIRLGDLARAIADTPPAVKVLLVDAGGSTPPFRNGRNPAPGLALMEPPENVVIGFSNAPDAIAPEPAPPYGPYAKALVEMMRLPGLGVEEMLGKTRLRVHEDTKGQQTPWNAGNLRARDFSFFIPDANAQVPPEPQSAAHLEGKGLRDFPPAEAYAIVVERDRIADYQEFLRIYPDNQLAKRVQFLLAQRREALLWRKAITRNTPSSYWTYLSTYPQGSFVVDARSRLARLQAPPVPPQDFAPLMYEDVPPPLSGVEIVAAPYAIGGYGALPPPPPPPVYILPPLGPDVIVFAPPPPRPAPYLLPVPVFVNRPQWARPPRPRPAPPPVNVNVQTAPVTAPAPAPTLAPNAAPASGQPQPAPQKPNLQQPLASPNQFTPPKTRQEFRQQLQQRQQQLQSQQGKPVTPDQRRQLRQDLRQEQLRALRAPATRMPAPQAPGATPRTPAPAQAVSQPTRPSPNVAAPDNARQQLQQQRFQQRQQQNVQDQQRQQILQQQRQQQQIEQRQNAVQQQRQQEMIQQRQQQLQQRQQAEQQRQQQMQARQQQMMQQRQQQIQQRQQQIQEKQQAIQQQKQHIQQQRRANCGQPGQPPCPQ